jgi:hypothetical protein
MQTYLPDRVSPFIARAPGPRARCASLYRFSSAHGRRVFERTRQKCRAAQRSAGLKGLSQAASGRPIHVPTGTRVGGRRLGRLYKEADACWMAHSVKGRLQNGFVRSRARAKKEPALHNTVADRGLQSFEESVAGRTGSEKTPCGIVRGDQAAILEEQPRPVVGEKCRCKGIESVANEGCRAIGHPKCGLPREPLPSFAENREGRGSSGRSGHMAPLSDKENSGFNTHAAPLTWIDSFRPAFLTAPRK